jgi:hypothetical protein
LQSCFNSSESSSRRALRITALAAIAVLPLTALSKIPERGKAVDSGTFGIYVSGQRVGTEQFRVDQLPNGDSVTSSEVSVQAGDINAAQSSELELSGKGDLIRYSWQEQSPGNGTSTVEPGEAVLMQHITTSPNAKAIHQKYLLPASTIILDDYFFVHREILAWRFLASNCKPAGSGRLQCQAAMFPALVPRQQTSTSVAIEIRGMEKVTIKGVARDLTHLVLHTASGDPDAQGVPDMTDWSLWLDSDHKLVRIAAAGMEVVRD